MRQYSFTYQGTVGNHVFIVDDNLPRFTSVTNAAEDVVAKLIKEYGGDKRFFYRDTEGDWDELVHDGKKFLSFRSIASEDEVAAKSLEQIKSEMSSAQ